MQTDNKREMIQSLTIGLSYLEAFNEPPEEVAEQFVIWLEHVASAFEAANMHNELKAWNEAVSRIRFSADGTSFPVQITSMKALLLGMLNNSSDGEPSAELFPIEIVQDSKSYVHRIAKQANGCYEKGWYDACAVMTRRLIETLIIECFENHSVEAKIKGGDGNYFMLKDLISAFLNEPSWHASRSTKTSLPRLKEIGDLSAHNRRFLASRSDIERHAQDIRITVQELVYIGVVAKGSAAKS